MITQDVRSIRFTPFKWLAQSTDLGPLAVLLEAPFDNSRRQKNSVLLTIDLTKAVADEAIKNKNSVVVAYRESNPAHTVEMIATALV